MSEFGHWVHRKDCCFCIVCLLFNNHLKRAAPVVRLKDLSWTLSRKLCINPNSQFTINLYLCCITPWTSASKINEWMIQLRATTSGETREFIRRATLTVHYGDSLAIECTSVVHLFLRCIVGLNECTREHPLWFQTPLKMAVPSNSALFEAIGRDFGYSLSVILTGSSIKGGWRDSQMMADWQMVVISARTNMLDDVCCSSRLACRERERSKVTEVKQLQKLKRTARIHLELNCVVHICSCKVQLLRGHDDG